jgi:hypothetical protein
MPEAAFRVPAGPAVAAVGIALHAWLLSTRTFAQAGILVGLMALGGALWALARRRAR